MNKNETKEFTFQLLSPRDNDKVKNNASVLRKLGFEIFDLREADIEDSNKSKIGEVYILLCRGTMGKYLELKEKFQLKEFIYEGLKTLE